MNEIQEIKSKADEGDSDAMYDYACYLYEGERIKQDKKEAARYFKLSADSDESNPDAALEYALMIDFGDGIQSNKDEAACYYEMSKDQGNILAGYMITINKIIDEIPNVKIFVNKFKSLEPIFKSIKKVIICLKDDKNQHKRSRSFNDLGALSLVISQLNNDNYFIDFLKNGSSIKDYLNKINENMKGLISSVNTCCKLVFNIPSEDNYEDIKQINVILSSEKYKNDELFKERRKEIEEIFKPIKSNFTDIMSKFDKRFKISPNDYKKLNKISENKICEIYQGEKSETKEKVKIIVLKKIENFDILFPILATLDNPSLETFYGASITESSIELVTFMKGEIYQNKNNCLTIIAFKIALAMSYLHSQKIIHTDLNLSNIFIENNNDQDPIKVNPIITNFINSIFLTEKSFLGMPNVEPSSQFSAPELTHNFRYDEKVDVFAFGGILYEFLTGKPPYSELQDINVKYHLIDNERPDFKDNSPIDIVNLINKCWHRKTKKHFTKVENSEPKEYIGQECRYSFDQIIDEMANKKIIFPSDEKNREIIEKFYENYVIKNKATIDCLDLFESIISGIECVAQFQFEFYRARLVLIQNKSELRKSEYANKGTLNEIETNKINRLKQALNSLLKIVIESQTPEIIKCILTKINYFTENLNKYMNEIYESMKDLGIENLDKYKEEKNDLNLDYSELNNYIDIESKDSEIKEITENLKSYMSTLKINSEQYKDALFLTIKTMLSPFKAKQVDQGDFYYNRDNLNDGNEARVYKGVYMKTGQEVAIKIVKDSYLKISKNLVSLRREIRNLTSINHKYISKFIGYSISDVKKDVWIITEFIPNNNLCEAKQSMDPYQKTKVAFEIAELMEYLHYHRFLYRDLKTDNIMMSNDSLKIIDFGLSRYETDSDTITGKQGTHNYMAPEVFIGNKYGRAADVYSFAMVLWELLSLKNPFEKLNLYQIMAKVISGVRPTFEVDCQENLKDLIQKGWDKDPDKRPSFSEIIDMMIDKKISFLKNGEKDERIDSFYENKAEERKKLKNL